MWKSQKHKKSIREIKTLTRKQTKFNHIFVTENKNFRDLWLGKGDRFFLQSRVDVNQRTDLVLIYSKLMMSALLFQPRPLRILIIGLGGGALCHFLNHYFPEARIDVAEIDSGIIDVAKHYFFVREMNNIHIHHKDGRVFIESANGKKAYDIVLLDAFKSDSIPYHLKTLEFYHKVRRVLSPSGVVVSNLYGKSNRQKQTDRLTFASVFNQICLFEDTEQKATVLAATHGAKEISAEQRRQHALSLIAHKKLPDWILEVVELSQAGSGVAEGSQVFRDDFCKEDFLRAVIKNNLDRNIPRPCPINQF